jgi:hypothetical protein
VIVRVDDRGVHILSIRIDWSSQIPKVIAKARNTLPLSSTAAEVAQAITRVWAQQLSKYQWCPLPRAPARRTHVWQSHLPRMRDETPGDHLLTRSLRVVLRLVRGRAR